jgi:transposase
LNGWLYKAKNGEIDLGAGSRTPSESLTLAAEIQKLKAENKALQRENSRIKEENEFLEEASAFFAASRQKLKRKNGSNL